MSRRLSAQQNRRTNYYGGSAGAVPSGAAFTPASIAGLALWLRADLGITYVQGPVVAAGTSPPAVTFAGTPSSSANSIILTCTGAGTNTTATFSWTLNGVAQTPFTAAATVLLPGSGITATFPVGSYTNTPSADTYTSVVTVSTWADQSGHSNSVSQAASANQPSYLPSGGSNGTPYISVAAGGPQFLKGTFSFVQPEYIWAVVKFLDAAPAANEYVVDGNTLNTMAISQTSGGNTVAFIYAGTSIVSSSATTLNSWHAIGASFSGASSSIAIDSGAPVSGNAGSSSASGITVGCGGDGASAVCNASIAEIVGLSSTPSAGTLAQLNSYRTKRYGF